MYVYIYMCVCVCVCVCEGAKNDRMYIRNELMKRNVRMEVRALSLGDVMWVVKHNESEVCMCVCVCMRERERERERDTHTRTDRVCACMQYT